MVLVITKIIFYVSVIPLVFMQTLQSITYHYIKGNKTVCSQLKQWLASLHMTAVCFQTFCDVANTVKQVYFDSNQGVFLN